MITFHQILCFTFRCQNHVSVNKESFKLAFKQEDLILNPYSSSKYMHVGVELQCRGDLKMSMSDKNFILFVSFSKIVED